MQQDTSRSDPLLRKVETLEAAISPAAIEPQRAAALATPSPPPTSTAPYSKR